MIIIVFLGLLKLIMKRFLERTLWKLVKEVQSSALSIITFNLALSCNH